jgi:hypothetical protein
MIDLVVLNRSSFVIISRLEGVQWRSRSCESSGCDLLAFSIGRAGDLASSFAFPASRCALRRDRSGIRSLASGIIRRSRPICAHLRDLRFLSLRDVDWDGVQTEEGEGVLSAAIDYDINDVSVFVRARF